MRSFLESYLGGGNGSGLDMLVSAGQRAGSHSGSITVMPLRKDLEVWEISMYTIIAQPLLNVEEEGCR
jgi:hypothetical protein